MRQAVAVDVAEIAAGRFWQAIKRGRLHVEAVVETAELVRQIPAAMSQYNFDRWVTLE